MGAETVEVPNNIFVSLGEQVIIVEDLINQDSHYEAIETTVPCIKS